jgi:hypothetical protein
MSERAANCPGCGAPLRFAWSSAVQTACPYCKAIVVRTDVDLEKVGELADLPPDASPLQIGTAGEFDGRGFAIVGRIRYEWEQGNWNEWHLAFHDGGNGWLADAQLTYAVSFERPGEAPAVDAASLQPNQRFHLEGQEYVLTTVTQARYAGFEGELPFTTSGRNEMTFADLRTVDARFATLDFSAAQPVLYVGREVEYDELKLTNVRLFEGWVQ